MDLRPKIAREIVEALAADPELPGRPSERKKAEWMEIILTKMVSHSIPHPRSGATAEHVEAFLVKYPSLRQRIVRAETLAKQVYPEAKYTLELHSDPEMCHICEEGQKLTLLFNLPEEAAEAFDDLYFAETYSDLNDQLSFDLGRLLLVLPRG